MDDDILELVADNDQTFEVDAMNELQVVSDDDDVDRPSTASDYTAASTHDNNVTLARMQYLSVIALNESSLLQQLVLICG